MSSAGYHMEEEVREMPPCYPVFMSHHVIMCAGQTAAGSEAPVCPELITRQQPIRGQSGLTAANQRPAVSAAPSL